MTTTTMPARQITPFLATPESFVVQGNPFSRGRLSRPLPVHALRVIATAIAKLDNSDTLFNEVHISTAELAGIFESYSKMKGFGSHLRASVETIMGLQSEVMHAKGEYDLVNIITKVAVRRGGILVSFHEEARGLFLRLNSHFTRFPLKCIAQLPNSYAILLYQCLRSYAHGLRVSFTPLDLRRLLTLNNNEYPNPTKFHTRILDVALEHINSTSDIVATVDIKRSGQTITAYNFTIRLKNDETTTAFERAAISMLADRGMAHANARRLVKEHGTPAVVRAIASSDHRAATNKKLPIRDMAAYLTTCTETDKPIDTENLPLQQVFKTTNVAFYRKTFGHLEPAEKMAHAEAFLKEVKPDVARHVGHLLKPSGKPDFAKITDVMSVVTQFDSHPTVRKAWDTYLGQFLNPEIQSIRLYAAAAPSIKASQPE